MLRMSGNIVELGRYKIAYTQGEVEQERTACSTEEKEYIEQGLQDQGIEFTTTEVDQTENDWIEGLEFENRMEALDWLGKGEQAYLQDQQQRELADNLRLRADLDFVAIMSGVEI